MLKSLYCHVFLCEPPEMDYTQLNDKQRQEMLDTIGVDGIDVVIGTSSYLRDFSHGKSIEEIINLAQTVLTYIREQNSTIELRFSTEDSRHPAL